VLELSQLIQVTLNQLELLLQVLQEILLILFYIELLLVNSWENNKELFFI